MTKIIELSTLGADRYTKEFNASPLVAKVLAANEVSIQNAKQLFFPTPRQRCDDARFFEATRIIRESITQGNKIMVCGDYDADGLCATSILVLTLRKLGADVGFYIPDRFNEGYGLHVETVRKAIAKGYKLFITVDNGVSAFEALECIHENNATVLVVDHHEMTQEVPCDILIHPSLLEDKYANMCGSGLALQLAEHLTGVDDYITTLAGIATVGDMVDLWGENRRIVIDALVKLNEHRYPTIEALMEKPVERYDEETLAFQIVPKLNVAGRLADVANANRIVDYLCSITELDIQASSKQIIALNQKRKQLSQSMYDTARSLNAVGNVVVLTHHSFHEGIVGITAGRLAREIGRPVFVFAEKGESLKGSARSVTDVDLRELTSDVQSLCIRYGGHAMAAGLEIRKEDLGLFIDGLKGKADLIDWTNAMETLAILRLEKENLNKEDFFELLKLGPFGSGFPMPLIRFDQCEVVSFKEFSANFRKWQLRWGSIELEAVDFGEAKSDFDARTILLDVIGKVKIERFRNREKLSILVELVGQSL